MNDRGTISDIGPRAPIFGPSPIGAGTADVESLSGYVLRLAAHHYISLYMLLRYRHPNLDPCFEEAVAAIAPRYDTEFRSGGINGSAQGAIIARAFAKLTGRPDVACTTFSAYNGNAGLWRFIQRGPKWCPRCLRDDSVPYERLLWNARLLTVCPDHQIRLKSKCPHCGTPASRQIVQGSLFFCRRCKKPLFTGEQMEDEASPAEIAESRSLAQFCQALFKRTIDLTKYDLIAELCRFAEGHGIRSFYQKGDFLGVSKSSLAGWHCGASQLTLVRFIEICSSLGITPLQLLLQDQVRAIITTKGRNKTRSRFWLRSKRSRRWSDKESQISQLREAHEKYPTLGVKAIARQIGQESSKFFHWFPKSCHAITCDVREARRQKRLTKVAAVKDEVGGIIKALLADGVRPTMRNVAQRMRSPGWFRSAEIRTHMAAVLLQLNALPTARPAVVPAQNA